MTDLDRIIAEMEAAYPSWGQVVSNTIKSLRGHNVRLEQSNKRLREQLAESRGRTAVTDRPLAQPVAVQTEMFGGEQ